MLAVLIANALRTSKLAKILISVTKCEAYRILFGKHNQKITFERHGIKVKMPLK